MSAPRLAVLAVLPGCLWIGPGEQADRLDSGPGVAMDLRLGEVPAASLCADGVAIPASVDGAWAGASFQAWIEVSGRPRVTGPTAVAGAAVGGRATVLLNFPVSVVEAAACDAPCDVPLTVGLDHPDGADQASAAVSVVPATTPVLVEAALLGPDGPTAIDVAERDPDDGFATAAWPEVAAGVDDPNLSGAAVSWLACSEDASACQTFPATATAAVAGDAAWTLSTEDLAALTCGEEIGSRWSLALLFEGHICGDSTVEVHPPERWLGDDCDADGDPRGSDCADLDPTRAAGLADLCGDDLDSDCDPTSDGGIAIGETAYATLAAAVAAGSGVPGAVVRICGGSWPASVEITGDLSIEGYGETATLTGDGTAPVIALGNPPTEMGPPPDVTVSLTNLVISGGGGTEGAGVAGKAHSIAMTDCVVTDNHADGFGGGMLLGGGVALTRVEVHGNSSAGEAGGIGLLTGDAVLLDVSIHDNSAETRGGGMLVRDASVAATTSTVTANAAPTGAGVYGEWVGPPGGTTSLAISGLVIDANEGTGLLIRLPESLGAFEISDVTVSNHDDSGVRVTGGTGTVSIVDSSISDNAGPEGGGLFSELTGTLTLDGGDVSGNTATLRGGGLHLAAGTVEVRGTLDVAGNTAPEGAGIATLADLRLRATGILGNEATGAGGGILVSAGVTSFYGDLVLGNLADSGDGLFVDGTGLLQTCGSATIDEEVANADGSVPSIGATCTATTADGPVATASACGCPP